MISANLYLFPSPRVNRLKVAPMDPTIFASPPAPEKYPKHRKPTGPSSHTQLRLHKIHPLLPRLPGSNAPASRTQKTWQVALYRRGGSCRRRSMLPAGYSGAGRVLNLQKKAAPVQSPLGTAVPVISHGHYSPVGHHSPGPGNPSGSARRLRHDLLQRRLIEQ